MSIRSDASGENLTYTADGPSGPFSACGWFYISSDSNNYASFFRVTGGADGWYAQTQGDGTTLTIDPNSGSTTQNGTNLSVGAWNHIGLTVSATTCKLYLNGVLDVEVANAAGTTATGIRIGGNTTFLNGRMAAFKVWSGAELSAAEFAAEMLQTAPVRTADIWGSWPLRTITDISDWSGSRDLTANGTLTTEDGPEIVSIVDPDMGYGYDYDSLYDWEAGQQQDLVTNDQIAVAKCRCTGGTADTTAVTIDGWTVDSTRNIKNWTDPAESYRHNGTYQTGNKYRIEVTSTKAIRTNEEFTRIIGIATKSTKVDTTSTTGISIQFTGTGIAYVDSCICVGVGGISYANSDAGGISIYGPAGGSNVFVSNCICYGWYSPTGSSYGFGISPYLAGGNVYIYNCTFKDNTCGIYNYSTTTSCKNVLSTGSTNGDFENFGETLTCTNCASEDTTADDFGGSGNRVSQTFTFVSATDFHLASNDAGALGYGLNLYNDANYPFQTDIDGDDRGGAAAAWDIGADESVAAGGSSIVPLLLYLYRARRQ